MMKYVYSGALTFLFLGMVLVPSAQAQTTTSVTSMLEQVKALMAKVEELQKQLATIRGEIKDVIRTGIAEGMTGDDIKQIQELLATDTSIYPEGKVTGYFGPLTKEAVKRLQARHGLSVTGVVDEETHDLLESYLKERFGDRIPPGLLRAPGIMKKVEDRVKFGCDNKGPGHGMGPLCKKLKTASSTDDDSDDDSDDEDNDDSDELEVEIETENGSTTVSFTFEGEDYDVEVGSDDLDDILAAVADELDVDVEDLDEDLVDMIEEELGDATDEDENDEAEEAAEDAIDDADEAIDDAEDTIDDADGDTDAAEGLLDQAKDKLDEAEEALDDEDYDEAEDLANEAKELAEDAVDALPE